MARHRNVRKLNYADECDFDDIYGRSAEEEYCISPNTEAEFMYDRGAKSHNISAFFADKGNYIPEEERETEDEVPEVSPRKPLNDTDRARLNSCLDYIHEILSDALPESELIEAIIAQNFNAQEALNAILNSHADIDAPKQQRQPRRDRRWNRDDNSSSDSLVESDNDLEIMNEVDSARTLCNVKSRLEGLTMNPSTCKVAMPSQDARKGQEAANTQDNIVHTEGHPANGVKELKQQPSHLNVAPVNVVKGFMLQTDDKIQDTGVGTKSPSPSAELIDRKEGPTSVIQKVSALKIKEPGSNNGQNVSASRVNALAEYQNQRGSGKQLLNLVVIGHVDAGKSTLMGHLLCLMGAVSQKVMHKYEQESKKIGKASFVYAWVLDETGEERSRGITMDVGQFKFETDSKIVILLDAPGHKDFIPNMITGASQADVAILVVDSTRGEFETGFESGGQTREHALLVRSLGVSQLTVAVNKLDTVNWSQERFVEITKKLGSFLKQAGFKESDISYVPCSGLTGENLKEQPRIDQLRKWYKGPTLLQQIDNFKSPERPVSKPFRMSVTDVFKGQGSGFSVSGKIETGIVNSSDKVLVMPQGETAQIKGMSIDDLSVQTLFAGDSCVVTLSNVDMSIVAIGCILCTPAHPIRTSTSFQARIVVFNIDVPITKGFPVILHYQSLSEPAIIKKLVSQLHKSTGEVIKKKPRCIGKQTSAVIEIETGRPICIELYKDIKELGRFMLRSSGQTIAAGLVTQIF